MKRKLTIVLTSACASTLAAWLPACGTTTIPYEAANTGGGGGTEAVVLDGAPWAGSGGSGGRPVADGGGGSPEIPMPPSERGKVVDGDVIDLEATGCCSRVPDAPLSVSCPSGSGQYNAGVLSAAGDSVALGGTLATGSVGFQATAFQTPNPSPVTCLVIETEIPPPSGIIDLSPVYWITSDDPLPPLALRVPFSMVAASMIPDEVHIYFSVDGKSYAPLANDQLNAGFIDGVIDGGGFVVAGSTLAGISCGAAFGSTGG